MDIGKDAVILNTKRIKTGGFLGLFKKVEFEVLAAIDEDKMREVQPKKEQVQVKATPLIPIPTLKETRVVNDQKNSDREILKEVKEMREIMVQLVKHNGENEPYPHAFSEVVERLRDQEVEEQVINYLIGEALKVREAVTINNEEAVSLIADQITSLLQSRSTSPFHPETRLFHIVGPTGVGKTTTIAKLAANFKLKQHKSVGLITTDTYRISAIDQLRTYANILNAPLEVVYKADELQNTTEKLENNDLIILDTAGRNYRNDEYVQELSQFLCSTLPAETFLALSLTAKYRDNLAIIRQFSSVNINKVIYTKMDETETYGSIVNIAFHHPLQLSFITNGQTVPDDLLIANPEHLTKILLGGVNHA
jgi:flagellar biosynthesis protein FlhF